ncbi:hypothetical protein CYLTODRAFT_489321 [Cylindrobasidium torrendii FP15055 ss-10]|uniref:Uncharacterized protein n=1 Tax=Cylindrobasidium torrendii FP15055 ss-10 TaxID=1314674 RepID=A0A0D7BEN9_9AGAR|nr:hypothetical protein CYLTODRAFT_489321 [Cylindrobasidium torrendii FP15055 ss-10]
MHLLIPVDCASSCALKVLLLALCGLALFSALLWRIQHARGPKLSSPSSWRLFAAATGFVPLPEKSQHHHSDVKVPLDAVESQRRFMYESRPPVSMAKMIMSRHTFRRPTPRPAPPPRIHSPPAVEPPPRRSSPPSREEDPERNQAAPPPAIMV